MITPQRKLLARTRRVPPKSQRKRILISCEGKVTERIYINGLKKYLRGIAEIDIGFKSGNPLEVVRGARDREACDRRKGDKNDRYERIWCVMDVESPPHECLTEALRLAEPHKFDAILSNPCFEVWLVWHFADHTSACTTGQMNKAAKMLVPTYTDKHFDFDAVFQNLQVALVRAKAVSDRRTPEGHPMNPASDFWQVVESLGFG